jgi:hypothetical protein
MVYSRVGTGRLDHFSTRGNANSQLLTLGLTSFPRLLSDPEVGRVGGKSPHGIELRVIPSSILSGAGHVSADEVEEGMDENCVRSTRLDTVVEVAVGKMICLSHSSIA